MPKLSKVEQALAVLEAAKAAGKIPDCLQEKVVAQGGIRSDVKGALSDEAAPEVKGIARFRAQYESLKPEYRADCAWQEVESLLIANNGHYLKLAEAMQEGGILFGVDKNGNPLIADGGVEPILTDMNYADTRKAVMWKEVEGEQVSTGYELFPLSIDYEISDEMLALEKSIDEPFIRSGNKKEWRGSWLESGEKTVCPRYADFDPGFPNAIVKPGNLWLSNPYLGTRRLLRVKKS